MKDSVNQLIEKLASTLNFFDFTFIVSGFLTCTIIYYTLGLFIEISVPDNTALNIISGIIFVYICGILSFVGGKKIRTCFMVKRFIQVYSTSISAENRRVLDKNKRLNVDNFSADDFNQLYTRMWVDLRHDENGIETVRYLNRSVMMQSICEGLLFSSLLMVISSLVFYIQNQNIYVFIVGALSVLSAYFFKCEAQRSAEIQIKELVSAYYKFVLNA